jgi:hypothetical protein
MDNNPYARHVIRALVRVINADLNPKFQKFRVTPQRDSEWTPIAAISSQSGRVI